MVLFFNSDSVSLILWLEQHNGVFYFLVILIDFDTLMDNSQPSGSKEMQKEI